LCPTKINKIVLKRTFSHFLYQKAVAWPLPGREKSLFIEAKHQITASGRLTLRR
jgi:hypothetical protein